MRRLALVIAVLGAACGTPEQLLRVTAMVEAFDSRQTAPVPMTLQADDGATVEGCGEFGTLRALKLTPNEPYAFDVLRGETIGPNGTPRCFRLDWKGQSTLSFGPLEYDVRLPEFTVWPGGPNFVGDSARFSGRTVSFHTVPSTFLRKAEDELDVLPPRHFVEVFDDRGVLAWRLFQGDVVGGVRIGGSGVSALLSDGVLEDRPGTARGGAFRVGRTYALDALGRPQELRFEHRVVTNDVEVSHFTFTAPPSRGAKCEGHATCPYTDGDFTVVPSGETVISFDLGKSVDVSLIMVRGLWAEPPTRGLRLELSATESIEVPLDEQVRLMNRDGAMGPGRMDVQIFTGRPMQRVKLTVMNEDGVAVPISRLAEVSFFF